MFDLVIPTIGRPSLYALLASLARAEKPLPGRIFLVDDRVDGAPPIDLARIDHRLRPLIHLAQTAGAGPAAARNAGWRRSRAHWIAFLDDDVEVEGDWLKHAAADIAELGARDAGSQGRIRVPLPPDRPATDWERNVAGLQDAAWITADMIYARSVLEQLGGFDERFRHAYREDADLALRVLDAGFAIRRGQRSCVHPVRAADPWISVRLQSGNADDALMYALHGSDWRRRSGASRGRWPYHVATVLCFTAWAGLTADFAWRRIAPGPRTAHEVLTLAATSVVIPFAAVYHRARALLTLASLLRRSTS